MLHYTVRIDRPNSFKDLVGQDHIKTTIMNAIKLEKVAHAYLLSGPSNRIRNK